MIEVPKCLSVPFKISWHTSGATDGPTGTEKRRELVCPTLRDPAKCKTRLGTILALD